MSGLSRTPGKRVYGESRTAGSNPALSARSPLKISSFSQFYPLFNPHLKCPHPSTSGTGVTGFAAANFPIGCRSRSSENSPRSCVICAPYHIEEVSAFVRIREDFLEGSTRPGGWVGDSYPIEEELRLDRIIYILDIASLGEEQGLKAHLGETSLLELHREWKSKEQQARAQRRRPDALQERIEAIVAENPKINEHELLIRLRKAEGDGLIQKVSGSSVSWFHKGAEKCSPLKDRLSRAKKRFAPTG